MAPVTYVHVVKRYTADVTVVKDFNVAIKDKEFMVLVGPSGCGKSIAALRRTTKSGNRLARQVSRRSMP